MNIAVGFTISWVGGIGGGSVVSIPGTCSVIVIHFGLTTTGSVAVAVMVCSIPAAKFSDTTDSLVGCGFACIFTIGKQLRPDDEISVVTGSEGKSIGSLQVHNHAGSDIDFVGGEYANFVGIIGPPESVGFVY